MYLKELKLKNFRNYNSFKIEFSKNINIIYGNNAQGKTNLLEAIYVLGLTRSHRNTISNNLIKEGSEFFKVEGLVIDNENKTKMEIFKNSEEKKLKIDKKEIKKVSEFISNKFSIIIFFPEDLELIKGSPNVRRTFLNLELSQISNNYFSILTDYNKLLKIRNDYLKKLSKKIEIDLNYFNVITKLLIEKSILIYKMRDKFIKNINNSCGEIFLNIMKKEGFSLNYKPSCDLKICEDFNLLEKKYKQVFLKEKKLGTTLIGPHRDDFEILLNEENLKEVGSQGQQRIAVLSIKLSEIEIFNTYKKTEPILLLDDVFSELDDIKKNNLLKYIDGTRQIIITTTDLKRINKKMLQKAKIIKIKDAKIIKMEEVNYGK